MINYPEFFAKLRKSLVMLMLKDIDQNFIFRCIRHLIKLYYNLRTYLNVFRSRQIVLPHVFKEIMNEAMRKLQNILIIDVPLQR